MTVQADELTPWQHMANVRIATLEAARLRHAEKISDHGGSLAAMDHDVSNAQAAFRAQLAVLNALRATQNEQGELLVNVETGLAANQAMLQTVNDGVKAIIGMIDRLEGDGKSGG
jgi:hypothetical protein